MKSTRYAIVGLSDRMQVEKLKAELAKLPEVADSHVEIATDPTGESALEVVARGDVEAARSRVARAVKDVGGNVVIE